MDIQENKILDNMSEKVVLYKTKGTCSQFIEVGIKDDKISKCHIIGGCDGNTKGLSKIIIGMKPSDVISRLNGIRCGMKSTSCPDQLCRAIEEALQQL